MIYIQSARGRGIQDEPKRSENAPPWQRRGGRAIKKNGPKAPCLARTGWFVQATARIYSEVERTTPSAPSVFSLSKIKTFPVLPKCFERVQSSHSSRGWLGQV